jgi:hypothetical protein
VYSALLPKTVRLNFDQHPRRRSGPGHDEAVVSRLRLELIAATREKCRQPEGRSAGNVAENYRRRTWIAQDFRGEIVGLNSIALERFYVPSEAAGEILR